MKKHKNSNSPYCVINTPNMYNQYTGYCTICPDDYMYENKPFLFDYVDPYTKEHFQKVISRDYIIANATYCNAREYNRDRIGKDQANLVFRIEIDKLKKYAA